MEKVLAITVYLNQRKENKILENELEGLIKTVGGEVVATMNIFVRQINPKSYIGSGKVEEIKEHCRNLEIETVIFNNEMSGVQLSHLEKAWDVKIIDKTNLILDIFARHAKTKESFLQVELCQLQYRLPRLRGFRNYLSREGGGIGTRGPGEQKLELDRRAIRQRMARIRKELKMVGQTEEIKRKNRIKNDLPIITLVGYTNAGKSTIGNQLAQMYQQEKEDPFEAEDLLFKTLNTTLRKAKFQNGKDYLICDTVGFIQDIPTTLIEAFKSTLAEIRYSDLLLVVVDSELNQDVQLKTTMSIIRELKEESTHMITVFNKKDKALDMPISFYESENPIFISAYESNDVENLLSLMEDVLHCDFVEKELFFFYRQEKEMHRLLRLFSHRNLNYTDTGIYVTMMIPKDQLGRVREYL